MLELDDIGVQSICNSEQAVKAVVFRKRANKVHGYAIASSVWDGEGMKQDVWYTICCIDKHCKRGYTCFQGPYASAASRKMNVTLHMTYQFQNDRVSCELIKIGTCRGHQHMEQ